REAGGGVLDEAQRLGRLQLLADLQDLAQVAALDELHDDEVLPGGGVVADGEDLDDVGVAQRQADLALAVEQLDALRVLAPAAAQHLDGHHPAALRVLAAEDPAEAPAGPPAQHPAAPQR